jgi:hypothetical protein
MKRKRFLRTHRLSILAALSVTIAAVGLMAFVASAGADFTLSTGSLQLTNGTTTGTPPGGSWVLLQDKTTGAPFENPSTGAANEAYSLILGSGAEGLLLGQAQPDGGIFGPLTYFGGTNPAELFSAVTLTGSAPVLTFSGTDTSTGAHQLLGGNLLGLYIVYGGALYKVATLVGSGPDVLQALSGLLDGSALSGNATITLHWKDALLEPAFALYNALFQWVGTYVP